MSARAVLVLLVLWLALAALFESALAAWQRRALLDELERESRTLQSLLTQRVDQHDAHLTALSALAQVGDEPDRALLLELSSSIMRFYPRIDAIDLVSLDGSSPALSTRRGGSIVPEIERGVREAAARSRGELVPMRSPARADAYLLVKRSPNGEGARHGLSLEIDVPELLLERSGYWARASTSFSLALPDGTALDGAPLDAVRVERADQRPPLGELVLTRTLGSRTQPLALTTRHRPAPSERLPPLPAIGGPITLAALLALGAFIARLSARARRAELGERLGAHDARLSHASRVNALGEMASGIAHELNQPLTAVLGQSQAGLRLLRRETPEIDGVVRVLEANVAQAKRASAILQRLREWSSRTPRRSIAVSVNDCIANVVALIGAEARQSSIEIVVDTDPDDPLILADTVEIEQLVFNLVRNALESLQRANGGTHAEPCSGEPARDVRREARGVAAEAHALVRVSSRRSGDRVIVEVFDNGGGVAPAMRARLFEPFATDKPGGTGLGLALCARIVERSHGELSLVGDRTAGTTATISIPVFDRHADEKR